MSTDEAVQTITDFCRRDNEWTDKRYKPPMVPISRVRSTSDESVIVSRGRKGPFLPQFVVTEAAVEQHWHSEIWEQTETTDANGRITPNQPKLISRKTRVSEYRYADIIQLRIKQYDSGRKTLWGRSRVSSKGSSLFGVGVITDEDVNPLIIAFIKLCPNIK